MTTKEKLLKDEDMRHEKYLKLLDSFSDDELDNMSYWDLCSNGLVECDGQ